MAKHGLSEKTMKRVSQVLSEFPAVEKAVLFGSRAKGTHKVGSDIDLALIGPELDWQTIGGIHLAFDDSELPYRFSLVHWNGNTDPDVAAHILRVGIPVYERSAVTAP
jgi:predicted nucleotidyltransferase